MYIMTTTMKFYENHRKILSIVSFFSSQNHNLFVHSESVKSKVSFVLNWNYIFYCLLLLQTYNYLHSSSPHTIFWVWMGGFWFVFLFIFFFLEKFHFFQFCFSSNFRMQRFSNKIGHKLDHLLELKKYGKIEENVRTKVQTS